MIYKETPIKKELFRDIPPKGIYAPEDINLDHYSVVGYLQGSRVDNTEGLSIEHFDQIQFLNHSSNPITKQQFIHVIGYRIFNKRSTVLILEKI